MFFHALSGILGPTFRPGQAADSNRFVESKVGPKTKRLGYVASDRHRPPNRPPQHGTARESPQSASRIGLSLSKWRIES